MALESTPTPVRTVPAGLLPWLAALTVAVLYLLGRTLESCRNSRRSSVWSRGAAESSAGGGIGHRDRRRIN